MKGSSRIGLGIRIVLQGIMFSILTLIAFVMGENAVGQEAGGRTLAFMVLALSQIIQAFNMRSATLPVPNRTIQQPQIKLGLPCILPVGGAGYLYTNTRCFWISCPAMGNLSARTVPVADSSSCNGIFKSLWINQASTLNAYISIQGDCRIGYPPFFYV